MTPETPTFVQPPKKKGRGKKIALWVGGGFATLAVIGALMPAPEGTTETAKATTTPQEERSEPKGKSEAEKRAERAERRAERKEAKEQWMKDNIPSLYQKVKMGMSKGEVKAIMGKPDDVTTSVSEFMGDETRTDDWSYGGLMDDYTYSLSFTDGVLDHKMKL